MADLSGGVSGGQGEFSTTISAIYPDLADGESSLLVMVLEEWETSCSGQWTRFNEIYPIYTRDDPDMLSNEDLEARIQMRHQLSDVLELKARLTTAVEAVELLQRELEDHESNSQIQIKFDKADKVNSSLKAEIQSLKERLWILMQTNTEKDTEIIQMKAIIEEKNRIENAKKAELEATEQARLEREKHAEVLRLHKERIAEFSKRNNHSDLKKDTGLTDIQVQKRFKMFTSLTALSDDEYNFDETSDNEGIKTVDNLRISITGEEESPFRSNDKSISHPPIRIVTSPAALPWASDIDETETCLLVKSTPESEEKSPLQAKLELALAGSDDSSGESALSISTDEGNDVEVEVMVEESIEVQQQSGSISKKQPPKVIGQQARKRKRHSRVGEKLEKESQWEASETTEKYQTESREMIDKWTLTEKEEMLIERGKDDSSSWGQRELKLRHDYEEDLARLRSSVKLAIEPCGDGVDNDKIIALQDCHDTELRMLQRQVEHILTNMIETVSEDKKSKYELPPFEHSDVSVFAHVTTRLNQLESSLMRTLKSDNILSKCRSLQRQYDEEISKAQLESEMNPVPITKPSKFGFFWKRSGKKSKSAKEKSQSGKTSSLANTASPLLRCGELRKSLECALEEHTAMTEAALQEAEERWRLEVNSLNEKLAQCEQDRTDTARIHESLISAKDGEIRKLQLEISNTTTSFEKEVESLRAAAREDMEDNAKVSEALKSLHKEEMDKLHLDHHLAMEKIQTSHAEAMTSLRADFSHQQDDLEHRIEQAVTGLTEEHRQEMETLDRRYLGEFEALEKNQQDEILNITTSTAELLDQETKRFQELEKTLSDTKQSLANITKEHVILQEKCQKLESTISVFGGGDGPASQDNQRKESSSLDAKTELLVVRVITPLLKAWSQVEEKIVDRCLSSEMWKNKKLYKKPLKVAKCLHRTAAQNWEDFDTNTVNDCITDLDSCVERILAKYSGVQEELDDQLDKFSALEAATSERDLQMSEQIDQLRDMVTECSQRERDTSAQLALVQTEKMALHQKSEELSEELTNQEIEVNSLRHKLGSIQQEMARGLTGSSQDLFETNRRLDTDLRQQEADYQRRLNASQTTIKRLQGELEMKEASITSLEEKNSERLIDLEGQLTAALKTGKRQTRFLEEQTHERETERDQFQAEIEKLRKQLASVMLVSGNDEANNKLSDHSDKISELTSTLEQQETLVDDLKGQLTSAQRQLMKQELFLEERGQEMNLQQKMIEQLQEQLSSQQLANQQMIIKESVVSKLGRGRVDGDDSLDDRGVPSGASRHATLSPSPQQSLEGAEEDVSPGRSKEMNKTIADLQTRVDNLVDENCRLAGELSTFQMSSSPHYAAYSESPQEAVQRCSSATGPQSRRHHHNKKTQQGVQLEVEESSLQEVCQQLQHRVRKYEEELSHVRAELEVSTSTNQELQNQVCIKVQLISSLRSQMDERRVLSPELQQHQFEERMAKREADLANDLHLLNEKESQVSEEAAGIASLKAQLNEAQHQVAGIAVLRQQMDRLKKDNDNLILQLEEATALTGVDVSTWAHDEFTDRLLTEKDAELESQQERIDLLEEKVTAGDLLVAAMEDLRIMLLEKTEELTHATDTATKLEAQVAKLSQRPSSTDLDLEVSRRQSLVTELANLKAEQESTRSELLVEREARIRIESMEQQKDEQQKRQYAEEEIRNTAEVTKLREDLDLVRRELQVERDCRTTVMLSTNECAAGLKQEQEKRQERHEEELQRNQEELSKIRAELDRTRQELAVENASRIRLEADRRSDRQEMENRLRQETDEERRLRMKAEVDVGVCRSQLVAVQDELRQEKKKMQDATGQLELLNRTKESSCDKLSDIGRKLEEKASQLAERQRDVLKLRAENSQLSARISQLEQALTQSNSQEAELRAQLTSSEEAARRHSADDSRLQLVQRELESVRREQEQSRSGASSQRQEVETLRTSLRQRTDEVVELTGQVADLRSELAESRGERDTVVGRLTSAQGERDKALAELTRSREEMDLLRTKLQRTASTSHRHQQLTTTSLDTRKSVESTSLRNGDILPQTVNFREGATTLRPGEDLSDSSEDYSAGGGVSQERDGMVSSNVQNLLSRIHQQGIRLLSLSELEQSLTPTPSRRSCDNNSPQLTSSSSHGLSLAASVIRQELDRLEDRWAVERDALLDNNDALRDLLSRIDLCKSSVARTSKAVSASARSISEDDGDDTDWRWQMITAVQRVCEAERRCLIDGGSRAGLLHLKTQQDTLLKQLCTSDRDSLLAENNSLRRRVAHLSSSKHSSESRYQAGPSQMSSEEMQHRLSQTEAQCRELETSLKGERDRSQGLQRQLEALRRSHGNSQQQHQVDNRLFQEAGQSGSLSSSRGLQETAKREAIEDLLTEERQQTERIRRELSLSQNQLRNMTKEAEAERRRCCEVADAGVRAEQNFRNSLEEEKARYLALQKVCESEKCRLIVMQKDIESKGTEIKQCLEREQRLSSQLRCSLDVGKARNSLSLDERDQRIRDLELARSRVRTLTEEADRLRQEANGQRRRAEILERSVNQLKADNTNLRELLNRQTSRRLSWDMASPSLTSDAAQLIAEGTGNLSSGRLKMNHWTTGSKEPSPFDESVGEIWYRLETLRQRIDFLSNHLHPPHHNGDTLRAVSDLPALATQVSNIQSLLHKHCTRAPHPAVQEQAGDETEDDGEVVGVMAQHNTQLTEVVVRLTREKEELRHALCTLEEEVANFREAATGVSSLGLILPSGGGRQAELQQSPGESYSSFKNQDTIASSKETQRLYSQFLHAETSRRSLVFQKHYLQLQLSQSASTSQPFSHLSPMSRFKSVVRTVLAAIRFGNQVNRKRPLSTSSTVSNSTEPMRIRHCPSTPPTRDAIGAMETRTSGPISSFHAYPPTPLLSTNGPQLSWRVNSSLANDHFRSRSFTNANSYHTVPVTESAFTLRLDSLQRRIASCSPGNIRVNGNQ